MNDSHFYEDDPLALQKVASVVVFVDKLCYSCVKMVDFPMCCNRVFLSLICNVYFLGIHHLWVL